jgi:tetratricopeptide (TPR) repeat protein
MKRLALILLLAGAALPWVRAAASPVDDLFKQAQDASAGKRFDEAIALYERVFTEHAEGFDRWYDAQVNITRALASKGDLAEAAKAAHLCVDGAPNLDAYDQAANLAADILSAQDKNVDRANQLVAFEQSGAAGGHINPLDAVGYPALPERERAFATFRQQAGDDATAARFRAFTFLFSGKPRDALAQFADAFRRNENIYDQRNAGVELVTIGLRAAQGNRVGLDQAMRFVIYGPNGPDGKPGTADDLADPFTALLPPVPPAGEGGDLPAADLALLKKMSADARLYAGDPVLPSDGVRRQALQALQRLTTALDGWGAPGQKDWYLRLALGLGCPPPDEYTTGYLTGAAFAARGRAMNYGGLNALWGEISAACTAAHIEPPKHIADIHKQFDSFGTGLAQVQFPKIAPTPLKTPASF